MENDSPDKPRRQLQSLNLSLDVIEQVAKSGRPIGITEIANMLDLSKGAVHTILANFEARGYVQRTLGSSSFGLGRRIWELGLRAGKVFDLGLLVRDDLEFLSNLVGETVQITSYVSPGEVMFMYRVDSRHVVQTAVALGDCVPATTTSAGQVLLAHQPQAEIDRVLSHPLPSITSQSVTDPKAMARILETVRSRGYAMNENTHYPDTVTIATPIRDHNGMVSHALSLYGPGYRFTSSRAQEILPEIINVSARISQRLGFRP